MKTILLFLFSLAINGVFLSQDERVKSILTQFSTDSLIDNVKKLSGEFPINLNGSSFYIESRIYNNIGNENSFQWAKSKFKTYGFELDSLQFSSNGKNLYAIKKGTIFPKRICVLGAHYDNMPTGSIAPGADDNASGTAVVLEAARILSNYDFPNTIILALWDEEELGLFGSAAFASQFVTKSDSLLGYINLDMLGWDGNFDDKAEIHVKPVANSIYLSTLAVKANTDYNIGLNLEIVNPGSSNTDHAPFWQNGLSAIGINEEYLGDFNPYWHTLGDTIGNFNINFYEKNAKLAISTFSILAYNKTGNETISEILQNLILFPNPTSNKIVLSFSQAILEPLKVEIFSITGETIEVLEFNNFDTIHLEFENYSSGMYFIDLNILNHTIRKKIIKN